MSLNKEKKEYTQRLEKWENFLGLPNIKLQRTEIDMILNLNLEEIQKTSSIKLSEYSFMLHQYNIFLQQKSNLCDTFIKWANNTLNRVKGDDLFKINKQIKEVEIRSSRISYLARRIEMVAQALININRARYSGGIK